MKKSKGAFNSLRQSEARALMLHFLLRTGVSADIPSNADLLASRRYLWTDAFAVCNLLGLGEEKLAFSLIYHVHHILGKHRIDGKRIGWLSGLSEKEGEEHPTIAGLRIGKRLQERGKKEPIDERLEWDRDGQYFHYLTKWMHALDQVARWTKRSQFNRWARELAVAAHNSFTYRYPEGNKGEQLRMYWKMSIDLTYALVYSQGQHDPLDGYITYHQLRSTAATDLTIPCDQMETLLKSENWGTSDPLGLGCLLIDAFRVYQLMRQGASDTFKDKGWKLLEGLLRTAIDGIENYLKEGDIQQPAEYRLAFRELGLCIGLHGIGLMAAAERNSSYCSHLAPVREGVQTLLTKYGPLRDAIEIFWRDSKHRQGAMWEEHKDINDVMLATCLVPSGFLILRDH